MAMGHRWSLSAFGAPTVNDVTVIHFHKNAAWPVEPPDPLGYLWRTAGTYVKATDGDGKQLALIQVSYARRDDGNNIDEEVARVIADALRTMYDGLPR
jgi:hypothetical protein